VPPNISKKRITLINVQGHDLGKSDRFLANSDQLFTNLRVLSGKSRPTIYQFAVAFWQIATHYLPESGRFFPDSNPLFGNLR
jgi:hypothetical protein